MTWTTPKTWATGDLVTANDLNTQLSGNFNYLKPRVDLPNNYLNNTSVTNIVGTSFAQVLSFSAQYTYSQAHRVVMWVRSAYRTSIQYGELRFTFRITPLGGSPVLEGHPTYGVFHGISFLQLVYQPLYCSYVAARDAGTYTIEACAATTAGQGIDIGGPQHSQFGYFVQPITA